MTDAQPAFHLLGIGGAGMSALATIMLERGNTVSGSDLRESAVVDSLRALGADIAVGHDAAHVARAAEAAGDRPLVVVYSSAVPENNPERLAAIDHGATVMTRAHALADLMDESLTICVAGTHGKTTTTSMLTVALQGAGRDPSFMIGAAVNEVGAAAHAGTGDTFIAEADESDRSFLAYTPDIALVTNVELDHPDEFASDDDVARAFGDFVARVRSTRPQGGVAVIGIDDPGGRSLAAHCAEHDITTVTYGRHGDADVRLVMDPPQTARVVIGDIETDLDLGVPGVHNATNATGALAVCAHLGLDVAMCAKALSTFTGAARRFQIVGVAAGRTIVDDYAHHPTELDATIAAARTVHDGRIVAVVQPHRPSRTEVLGAALGTAAAKADVVVVTNIYTSGEPARAGVGPELVADAAREAGADVHIEPHIADLPARLVELTQDGDLVLLTGAGDITVVGPQLRDLLGT